MSVLAWDGKTLAADRQCSTGDLASRCTKIRRLPNGDLVAWTGGIENGLALADWYEKGADPKHWPNFQGTDNWCRLVVVRKGKVFTYETQPVPVPVEDRFHAWGSGRDFAMGALAMGADAVRAVKVASGLSITCGFGVNSFGVR